MPGLSPFAQSIMYGVITKSIGSIFRVADDKEAPRDILVNTFKREGILLGLTTLYTTFTQMVFSGTLGKIINRHPALKNYELVLRAGFTAVGIVMAEVTSRRMAPKTTWDQVLGQDGEGERAFSGPAADRYGQPAPYRHEGDSFQRRDDDDDDRDEQQTRQRMAVPVAPLPVSWQPVRPVQMPLAFSNTFTNPVPVMRFGL